MGSDTTAGEVADEAARSRWPVRLGRAGLTARGVLWLATALVVVQVLRGNSDSGGAIDEIAQQPFGKLLLVVLAVGFAGYTLWRLSQAWLNPHGGDGIGAWTRRAGYLANAAVYAALAVLAIVQVVGGGSGNSDQRLTRQLLRTPFGVPVVVAVALGLLGGAGLMWFRAVRCTFEDELRGDLEPGERRTALIVGRVGHGARGLVYGLVGVFLGRAALTFDPDAGVGLDGALREVAQRPFGTAALLVVAVGLVAYAAWCFTLARYGRIRRVE